MFFPTLSWQRMAKAATSMQCIAAEAMQAQASLAVNWRACMPSRHPGGGLAGGGCWPASLSGRLLTRMSNTLQSGQAVTFAENNKHAFVRFDHNY